MTLIRYALWVVLLTGATNLVYSDRSDPQILRGLVGMLAAGLLLSSLP